VEIRAFTRNRAISRSGQHLRDSPVVPFATPAPFRSLVPVTVQSIQAAIPSLSPEQLLAAQGEVLELVARGAPVSETLNAISRFSESALPAMKASVLVYEPSSQTLRKGGYGSLPDTFANAVDGLVPGPCSGSCGTAAFRKERVISEDVQVDPLWGAFRDFAAGFGIRSAWSSPILGADGRLLGVFGMYYGEARAPTAAELAIVDHFVHLAAIAVERHRADRERDQQATHDALTGLGNRRMLEQAIARITARDDAPRHTVALIDVDHFRLHNENLGHRIADLLLREAGRRIGSLAHAGEYAVRFAGDQFVLVTPAPGESIADRFGGVMAAFEKPFEVADMRIRLTVSAGVVEWDPLEAEFDDALYQAEQACAAAKARGRERWIAFGATERRAADERRRIARILTEAIAEQRVVPHLQPIVDLRTGRPVAFEALARLTGAAADLAPSAFIPIAEGSSLIDSIGLGVLRATCRVLAETGDSLDGIRTSVNLSIRQLMRDGFPKLAAAIVAEHGLLPDRICFEVTESEWLESDSPARDALLELDAMGFRLALDDFGTGYASLNQLQQLPFDFVKLDRSMISRLGDGGTGDALCEAAIRMAHACGVQVTAEGVETEAQAAHLKRLGCEHGQGYLWSRPVAPLEAVAWVAANRAR
jgi:diguanylate cyclase (GGDEF)-like protein